MPPKASAQKWPTSLLPKPHWLKLLTWPHRTSMTQVKYSPLTVKGNKELHTITPSTAVSLVGPQLIFASRTWYNVWHQVGIQCIFTNLNWIIKYTNLRTEREKRGRAEVQTHGMWNSTGLGIKRLNTKSQGTFLGSSLTEGDELEDL